MIEAVSSAYLTESFMQSLVSKKKTGSSEEEEIKE